MSRVNQSLNDLRAEPRPLAAHPEWVMVHLTRGLRCELMLGRGETELIGDIPGPRAAAREFSAGVPERQGWGLYQTIRFMLRWLRWWVRLDVRGLEHLPSRGAALIVSNHDAWLDPLVIIEAMMWKQRQLRFLAKASLWKTRFTAWILNGAGQIPIRRGESDSGAIEAALAALDSGEAIGIFPEGTLSRGTALRARRGVSRLALARPDVPIVLVAVQGGTDLKRFPKRPQVSVEFFPPAGGQTRPGEDPAELAQRLLDEVRERVCVTK
jgi:1-acyl-sn-glycerol-3-phosphate acyltransferase